MLKAFFGSRKWFLWAYGGASILLLSLWVQVQITVAINGWYGRFYDLLQNAARYKDSPDEGIRLLYEHLVASSYLTDGFVGSPSFAVLAFPFVVIAVLTSWFTRMYGLRWREAITFNYIPRWRSVAVEIEGASQRIQEDCNRFARIVESLGLQVVRATMTLIAFIPILWGLSSGVAIPLLRDIHGSLVWGALLVSVGGLVITWFVGWRLPRLEYNNQLVEAAFRKDLVLAEDDKDNYAKPEKLWELFVGIRRNYHRLYLNTGYLDVWIIFYDQTMVIVPYLIMGPGLFTGLITLGVLVQVSNAFQQVHGGFSLFLHNWNTITELRSIWMRLHEFERNLDKHRISSLPIA